MEKLWKNKGFHRYLQNLRFLGPKMIDRVPGFASWMLFCVYFLALLNYHILGIVGMSGARLFKLIPEEGFHIFH